MRGLLAVAVVVGTVGLAWADKPAPRAMPKKTLAAMAGHPKPKPATRAKAPAKDWAASAPAAPADDDKDAGKVRLLHTQGLSAYKAGNYNAAVKKFAAAMDSSPSPELLYHAAQAYRLKGERAKALELYERYLKLAPDGSAAPVCRWYVERLRDTP